MLAAVATTSEERHRRPPSPAYSAHRNKSMETKSVQLNVSYGVSLSPRDGGLRLDLDRQAHLLAHNNKGYIRIAYLDSSPARLSAQERLSPAEPFGRLYFTYTVKKA